MILLLLILLLIAALLLTAIVCLITLQLWRMLFGEAPFISTQSGPLHEIITHIPLRSGITLYELGCGDGRVLIACHQKEPHAQYIGIEKNLLPYLLAQWRLFRYGRPKNITILKKNLFQIDYSEADIIYAYLFPAMLDALLPKLMKELRPEAITITPTFRFAKKQPSRSLQISEVKSRIREVYITTF